MTIKSFTRLVGAAVVVMVCWIGAAQAQEDEDVFSNNMTLAALINVFHFEDGNNVWSALLTTSVSAGIGYHFNIIPNTFSPGIYVDAGVSLLQLILAIALQDSDDESVFDGDTTVWGHVGIRLYNRFRFDPLDIQPFAGVGLMGVCYKMTAMGNFGVLFAFRKYAVEYGYIYPLMRHKSRREWGGVHRLGVGVNWGVW